MNLRISYYLIAFSALIFITEVNSEESPVGTVLLPPTATFVESSQFPTNEWIDSIQQLISQLFLSNFFRPPVTSTNNSNSTDAILQTVPLNSSTQNENANIKPKQFWPGLSNLVGQQEQILLQMISGFPNFVNSLPWPNVRPQIGRPPFSAAPAIPALPTIPVIPAIPANSAVQSPVSSAQLIPSVPQVHSVPEVPQVPSIPTIPSVPAIPVIPTISPIPTIPKISSVAPKTGDEKTDAFLQQLVQLSSTLENFRKDRN